MKLVFINYVGKDYLGTNIYEFLFYNGDTKHVDGINWDAYPADGNPQPPVDFIDAAYRLKTNLTFHLIQNHESFDMYDCKQGVIAMAWESDKDFDMEVYGSRLFFSYSEEHESVEDKLYERDMGLEKIFINENTN